MPDLEITSKLRTTLGKPLGLLFEGPAEKTVQEARESILRKNPPLVVTVGDVVSFRNANLRDIFVKNRTAGSNGKVVIVATVPQKVIKEILRF